MVDRDISITDMEEAFIAGVNWHKERSIEVYKVPCSNYKDGKCTVFRKSKNIEDCMDTYAVCDMKCTYIKKFVSSLPEYIHKDDECKRKQQPWISTRGRLPEEGQKVFFVLMRLHDKQYLSGVYRDGKWITEATVLYSNSFQGTVTYWMPMLEV